tara:strand:- start:181 stop:675 length:495 start_codon:yes stop_codon:yes gene_type:complete
MILIEDSITNDLYQNCAKELDEKLYEHCWKSSSLNWLSDVKKGVDGSCIITPVSDTIKHLLEQELKSSLPKYRELEFNYYIWQHHAGISWHNDIAHDRAFGATLYLNDQWHPDNGGWFIWEDDNGYHTILPKKKFLIISDNYQHHCVTPVAMGFRCTIQIWGLL